jgi:hypothetical protein
MCEYGRRYGNENAYRRHLEVVAANPLGLPDTGRTPFLPASVKGHEDLLTVPGDPVASCRRYYAFHALRLLSGGRELGGPGSGLLGYPRWAGRTTPERGD